MSTIGIAITKLTSQFGVLSRKASVRIATETGKKLVDKTNQVGRALNKSEIEEVFVETLPKRCRPKIYITEEELVEGTKKSLLNRNDISEAVNDAEAFYVPSSIGKGKIFLPVNNLSKESICGDIAHELEHALEYKGNALKEIWKLPFMLFEIIKMKIKGKNPFSYAKEMGKMAHNLENSVINAVHMGTHSEDELCKIIRGAINPNSPKTTQADYAAGILLFDKEIRAYKAGNAIEKYMKKGTSLEQQNRLDAYEKVKKILENDLKIFKKNKKSGKFEYPLKYEYDKDFTRLIPDEENRKFVMSLAENPKEKDKLYDMISYFETDIGTLREFLNKNGLAIGKNVKINILSIDADVLKRPNIMSILKERKMLIE